MRNQREEEDREEERNLRRCEAKKRKRNENLNRPSGREREKVEEEEKKDALRNIRLIESNAKCRHLKKLTCKGTLRKVFICLRTPPLLFVWGGLAILYVLNMVNQREG